MPNLNIEMFDDEPKVGDKIKVIGVIKSISDDGRVEASYDEVSVIDEKKKKKKSRLEEDMEDDDSDDMIDYSAKDMSLDAALEKSFPNTQ